MLFKITKYGVAGFFAGKTMFEEKEFISKKEALAFQKKLNDNPDSNIKILKVEEINKV